MKTKLIIVLVALPLALGCVGDVPKPDPIDDSELEGAGGRDLTEYWPSIDVPFSENTRMLNFDQMRNEVLRATGLSWLINGNDQWEAHRSILGGADYNGIEGVWLTDRTPSQQKIVTLRKMAFTVCGDLVTQEAGGPGTVFDLLDVSATIDTAAQLTTDQVTSVWTRFFYEAPSTEDVADSLSLLDDLQAQASPDEAWRGLCGAYLSSMRFLSY